MNGNEPAHHIEVAIPRHPAEWPGFGDAPCITEAVHPRPGRVYLARSMRGSHPPVMHGASPQQVGWGHLANLPICAAACSKLRVAATAKRPPHPARRTVRQPMLRGASPQRSRGLAGSLQARPTRQSVRRRCASVMHGASPDLRVMHRASPSFPRWDQCRCASIRCGGHFVAEKGPASLSSASSEPKC